MHRCLAGKMCADMLGNYHQERESRLKVLFVAIAHNPRFIVSQLTLTAKLVGCRVRRLPAVARLSLVLLLLLIISYWMLGNRLSSDTFLQVGKCPACFGFTICNAARSGDVWFTGWSKIRLLDYFDVNSVHAGRSKLLCIVRLGWV